MPCAHVEEELSQKSLYLNVHFVKFIVSGGMKSYCKRSISVFFNYVLQGFCVLLLLIYNFQTYFLIRKFNLEKGFYCSSLFADLLLYLTSLIPAVISGKVTKP